MRALIAALMLGAAASAPSVAQDCLAARDDAQVRECMFRLLRDADRRVTTLYQEYLALHPPGEIASVRDDERIAIRVRDETCQVKGPVADRDGWLRSAAENHPRAACLLDEMRKQAVLFERKIQYRKQTGARTQIIPDGAYRIQSPIARDKGRWYYEVSLQHDRIVRRAPASFYIGCGAGEAAVGFWIHMREALGYDRIERLGVAVDIGARRLYIRNGDEWHNDAAPGSGRGVELHAAAGRYACGIASTEAIRPQLEAGDLSVNFGVTPFEFYPPAGYEPIGTYVGNMEWLLARACKRGQLPQRSCPPGSYSKP